LRECPPERWPCLIGFVNVEAAYEATSGADDDDWRPPSANMTAGGRNLRHIAAANRLVTAAKGMRRKRAIQINDRVASSDHGKGLALFEAPRASVFGGDFTKARAEAAGN
jgi:hypothetical protein